MSQSQEPPAPASEAALSLPSSEAATAAILTTVGNVIPATTYHELPVVGLGGSAGSITELQKFFGAMPPTSGMAFVVVVHLSPEHESMLAELIQHMTSMPVRQVVKDVRLKANHVYVIAPGKHLTMLDGQLRLKELEPIRGKRVAVDLFFRT